MVFQRIPVRFITLTQNPRGEEISHSRMTTTCEGCWLPICEKSQKDCLPRKVGVSDYYFIYIQRVQFCEMCAMVMDCVTGPSIYSLWFCGFIKGL